MKGTRAPEGAAFLHDEVGVARPPEAIAAEVAEEVAAVAGAPVPDDVLTRSAAVLDRVDELTPARAGQLLVGAAPAPA